MPYKILICDDQPIIHETLGVYLREEGFDVCWAYDGSEALLKFESELPDMIILDIMMPKVTGIEVCREIRHKSDVPIIMLTAKGEGIDRVLGLELGADDYIVKPFSARELVARVKAVLRRYHHESKDDNSVIRVAEMEIDPSNYEVKINGTLLRVTPKEVEILELLASQPGKLFEREKILERVWGYYYYSDTRIVDTQIKRIRQKLPEGISFTITTVYGLGYKLELIR